MDISVCIISLWRETLYKTLETVFSQKIEGTYEVIIVLQWHIDRIRVQAVNPRNIPFYIYSLEHGLWFGYYRNKAIEYAKWDILAWIDDDEWTMDEHWLKKLTQPIKNGWYRVVTSGYNIQLGQWYMTDCISLLGWPGGGALGFQKMWGIGLDQSVTHLCTGNFAIKKFLIREIGFSMEANYGWEDNALSRDLLIRSVPIFYEKFATVSHIARSFSQALPWWKLRAKSYIKATNKFFYEESLTQKKLRFIGNVFILDRYIFGKLFCLSCILYFFVEARFKK